MNYFDTHTIKYYKQPKKVELKFLKPGDAINLYDVGDFDINITAVILDYKINEKENYKELEKLVVLPSGKIDTLYSYIYGQEPVFEVVGYATTKNKNDEETLSM